MTSNHMKKIHLSATRGAGGKTWGHHSKYGIYLLYTRCVKRGCIFTPPELVGLWLGSVGIQQAIYSAYEFVTCYDRCMYMYKLISLYYGGPVSRDTGRKVRKPKKAEQFETPPVSQQLEITFNKYQALVVTRLTTQLSLPLQ